MNSKEHKPEVSIDTVKEVVKRLKNQGLQTLTHHDLAVALTTIGFKQVTKQFGATWGTSQQSYALQQLANSQYDLSWYGKTNNPHNVPFLQLCARGDIEKVKQFLFTVGKKGKPQLIATTDNFKRTALHLAVRQGFDVLAEYLITEGFSLNARDRQLKTPLHYCKSQLVCQLLLKKGANVVLKDNKNCTVAHYAASGPQYKVLQLILQKTNVANQVDATLKTPLFYTIYNGSDEQINVMRVLLENGAKVNHQDLQGRTPLHYAAELAKTRCIPFLLQKGASVDIKDKSSKTPLELCPNEKIIRLFAAYRESRGIPSQVQEKVKRTQFSKISGMSKLNQSKAPKQNSDSPSKANPQIFTKQVNQVSTWVREKFFVLMKKLQESGVKSLWHIKRPYIYTGSWAQDVDGLQDLYECFLNVSGPQAAMRTFNILCPFEKALPSVLGRSEQAFQSFFGENWFSTDPVEKVRNMHSQAKIRTQLQQKVRQNEDLQTQLLGYRSQIQKLEGSIMGFKEQLSHYSKIEDELRKERAKNTQQYTEILKHMNQIASLKEQLNRFNSGEQKTQILNNMVEQLRTKNEDLQKEVHLVKTNEAAARRKCGQLFLKSLAFAKAGQSVAPVEEGNLFDDDAIINLYELLRNNPPNLEKRFKGADRRGAGKLNIEEFTKMLEELSMLPQDVMSMHRITGFAQGRKTLSLEQFKTILENRHKNRPMWEKQLIRKIKTIILSSGITLEKFFLIVDVDGSGTVQPGQLRKGLEDCNIFMNQTDWSNLFNLLDADKSGTIELQEMKALFQQEATGKLAQLDSVIKKQQPEEEEPKNEEEAEAQPEKEEEQQEAEPQAEAQEEPEKQEKQEDEEEEVHKSENDLLSEQFKEQYKEEDSEEEAGIIRLNGAIKVQVPQIKDLALEQSDSQKIYIRFLIEEFETIKMADLSLPKLGIAVKFQMIEFKLLDKNELKMHVSVFKTRQFTQQNYLGEFGVDLADIMDDPNKWAVNNQFELEASEYEKDVSGSMVLQVKWIPKQQE